MKVFAWGRADYGQLGLGDDVVKKRLCSDPTEVTHVKGAKQVWRQQLILPFKLHYNDDDDNIGQNSNSI